MTPAPHPLSDYDGRHVLAVLAAIVAASFLNHFVPAGISHDFCALSWGYGAVTLILWQGRHTQRPWIIALFALLALGFGWFIAELSWAIQFDRRGFMILHAHLIVIGLVLTAAIFPVLIPRWFAWRDHLKAQEHAKERALLEARLAALQGQIEPHFLFNTLANVLYLLRRDIGAAEQMLDHLLIYFRATLSELRQIEAPLGQELARVRAYLDIMGLRMGERLSFRIDCPEELYTMPFPPLSLATLVENAIKHGIEPKVGSGMVTVSAGRRQGRFWVAVADDGVGFSETGGAGGIGLKNLRERLSLFRDGASLTLEPNRTGGVLATIEIPA